MMRTDSVRWVRRGATWAAYGAAGVVGLLLSPLVILVMWSPALVLVYGPHSEPVRALAMMWRALVGG